MLSTTTAVSLYGKLTKDSSTENLADGLILINDSIRAVCSLRPFAFLEALRTVSTVASQRSYQIPNDLKSSLADVYVTVGTTIYCPTPVIDDAKWKAILASNLGETDVPEFWYREGDLVNFAPIPATSGNTITFRGRKKVRDLSISDYTTGTIVSVANGGTAVVGNGTAWAASMAGRYIRITESDTANKGDGKWYEIASVASATALTLSKPYSGTAIAAGAAAYNIAQVSPIPEEYDIAPVYRAAALYYTKEDGNQADRFWRMYDGGVEAGLSGSYGGVVGRLLDEGRDERHYIGPEISTPLDPNWPERELASGF